MASRRKEHAESKGLPRVRTRMVRLPCQGRRARRMALTQARLPEEVPAPEVEELRSAKSDAKIEDIVHLM